MHDNFGELIKMPRQYNFEKARLMMETRRIRIAAVAFQDSITDMPDGPTKDLLILEQNKSLDRKANKVEDSIMGVTLELLS